MEAFVNYAASSNPDDKKQGLNGLITEIRKNRGILLIPNLSKFFSMLKDRLSETDWDILNLTLQITQEIIPNFGSDLESNFCILLPNLIILLADIRPGVGKSSMNTLCLFIKTTRNLESVMTNAIKHGLTNDDWKIRYKVLLNIVPFINLDLSYTANVQEMKRILERVIIMIKDTSAQVCETAKEVAAELKELCYDFPAVFSKITLSYQQLFRDHCEQIRGSNILRNSFQRISETPAKSILETIEKPKSFQSTSLNSISSGLIPISIESNKNNLVFGFIPPVLMQQLEDQENWRYRVNAAQELENIVMNIENFNDVMPYIAVFVRFLNKLLEDSNFKVSISAMNVIKEILNVQGVSHQANITQILPVCIQKLGDNKIAVRQSAFKVFMGLFRNSKSRVVSSVIIPQLSEALTSSNWHIREEVVIILLACMLDGIEYEYFSLVPELAKLLDDQKTKIRYVTTEALAILAQKNQAKLISILKPIVDDSAMAALLQRFSVKALPILTDEYVEFPKTFPNSAPAISSPYITASTFNTLNKTTNIGDITKNNESFTPNLNSSLTPLIPNKFKRLRPSPEVSFNTEEVSVKTPTKLFIVKADKSSAKSNYQQRFIAKQAQDKPSSVPPKNKEDSVRSFQSSSVITKLKPEYNQNEDQPVYLAVEELKKLPNPEEVLQKCLIAGSLETWSDQFEALNLIRRLLKHHAEVFISQVTLHNICLDLIKWADSLRSSLSKNALIVIGEMCESLGRTLDNEVNELLKIIIKKAIDTNIFLSEQAEVAIESMCKYSNENKIIAALLAIAQTNKNPLARAKVANCFAKVFRRLMFNISKVRDIEKIILVLSEYLTDAAFDVRTNSKEALIAISEGFSSEIEMEKLLAKFLSESARKKVFDAIHSKSFQGASSPTKGSAHREIRNNLMADPNLRNTRARSIGYSQDLPEFENISKITESMSSPEWKIRYNSIGALQDLTIEHSEALKSSTKLLNVLDTFCKGLSDQNLKVHIHTLNAFIKTIPVLGRSIEPHLSLVINSLLPGLGSANSSIREMARDVTHSIVQICESSSVLVPLTSVFSNANTRSKVSILALIIDLTPKVYEKKPNLVIKHVIPLAYKLAEDSKIEVREENTRLINKLYQIMGSGLFEHLPAGKVQKILEVLNEGM